MALQYVNSPESNFSRGIDARSSENQIQPGFVKDLLNADVIEQRVRKRPGTQGFAGNTPVRVTRLEYIAASTEACFTLDSAVDLDSTVALETLRSSPIVVYGRSSNLGTGPFNTTGDSVRYYPKFTIPTKKVLTAPSGTLSIDSTEHGLGTTNLFVSTVESTSASNRSYQKVLTDSTSINTSTYDINIDYTTYIDRNAYVFFLDGDPVGGTSYVATLNHTGSGSETFSIPTSTHNLSSYSIVSQVQQLSGATVIRTIPEEFLVAVNGDVSVTIDAVAAGTYYVMLYAASVQNTVSGAINANSSGTIVISAPTKPWVFFGIYLEQTPGGVKELVYPDTTDFDDVNNEFTLSFTNGAGTARNFVAFYEYGSIRSNKLCVLDAAATVSGTDESPQLTIWGLDHSDIYNSKQAREGWVTHIDSYRRSGEQRVVSGLGGNLFTARSASEAGIEYLMPTLYPNLFARTDVSRVLGPLFWDTGETPQRTRGYITSDASATNWATVTEVQFDTGNGWTKYTISLPNKLILDSTGTPTSLASVLSTSSNLEDWLTVRNMSWARHEGSFRIRQVLDGVNLVYIWVENSTNSSDYNDLGVGGECGVFSDQLSWLTSSPFIQEDTLTSTSIPTLGIVSILSGTAATNILDAANSLIEVPAGVLFNATRTSRVIPLREPAPSLLPSTDNLVRGDMLSYTGISRLLRVNSINPDSSRTFTITSDGTDASVTLTSGDTSFLSVGNWVLLQNAGVYSGEVEISDILSSTVFQFKSTLTDSGSGILAGETMEIDESLEWTDTPGDATQFQVSNRWIPVEHPDDSYDLTPFATTRYLDMDAYSDQSFLRSTTVIDNMYLTNGTDEPMKFDGSSIYRTGLPDWQPGLFVTQETTGATIVTDLRTVAYSAIVASEGKITITSQTTNTLPVGTVVKLSGSSRTYTVRDYSDDGAIFYLLLDKALDSGVSLSGSVSEIGYYSYYFRLNAVDSNDNTIASAATGSQDHVVEMTGNAAIQLSLVGMPALGNYDYDRIEVQIYRTKLNQKAPFYLVTTLPLSFNSASGYLQFRDSFADSDLNELDAVTSSILGQELGTGWKDPLRAKYITSTGNRQILANLKDYPQWDIQIVSDATLSNSTLAGDTFLFRRDSQDTATSTNIPSRAKYEWINGPTGTASAFSIGANQFSFTTSVATSASAGDWIYLSYDTVAITGRTLTYSGWWQIYSVVGTTITVSLVGAAAAASYPNTYTIATDPTDIPVLLGPDGNLGMVNGDSFDTFDSMRRLSMAINATMRQVDISISGMEQFTPWLTARGGNDVTPAGRLIVRSPVAELTTPEMIPTFSGYSLFVNSIRRGTGDQVSSTTKLFPSRLIMSYPNYAEIFNNPTSVLDVDSSSAIDVNSADGQEITGIIPFFGEAAFGIAPQSAVLVVFKSNSIYLVDLNEKAAGNNAVQRIETEGLGCTAPYSIAVTKKGIMFANNSGIYCLRRDQSMQYIGKYMERNWTENVDLNSMEIIHGHHYGTGRAYKLSVPYTDTIDTSTGYVENSQVFTYNHTSEEEGQLGAWGRYDNHPAIGWANLASDAFYASTNGRVLSIRRTGLLSDFRDDSEAIQFSLETRPNDFGNAGIRKVVDKAVIHYRSGSQNTGTSLGFSVDFEEEFSSTTPFNVNAGPVSGNGMGDQVAVSMVTVQHSISRRRGTYFAVQIQNDTMDEDIEVAGIDFRVGGLEVNGITEAANTK